MMQKLSKRIFHISMVVVIIIVIVFIGLMFALKYEVDGETDMPFDVKKISIISTVDGKDVESSTDKWELNVNQNNDIYIYIEKNQNYSKTEIIKNIVLDNFQIIDKPIKGNISVYKPSNNSVSIFENNDEYKIDNLEYIGDSTSSMQSLKISNQGGIIAFRCANNDLGTYVSNDDAEIEYNTLLKKLSIKNEDLKVLISFDITIKLNSNVSFKAENVKVSIPEGDIVENGTTYNDIKDMENVVFKRLEE